MSEVPEVVSYELLQDLLRAERRSNKLMPVATRFWILTKDYLATVTEEFRREQAKDPFGRKVMHLTDQVKNTRHAAESLWAVRERKIAMLALVSRGDRKRPEALTPEESTLYQELVEALDRGRAIAFELGQAAPAKPDSVPTPSPVAQPAPTVKPTPRAPEPKPVSVPSDTQAPVDLVTIRALGDIPPFVGPDMQTYLLKSGDIATVPPSIAQLLVRRQKASILEA